MKCAHVTILLNHVIKMYKKWSGYSLTGRTGSAGPAIAGSIFLLIPYINKITH